MAVVITPDAALEVPAYGDRGWGENMSRSLNRLEACRAIGGGAVTVPVAERISAAPGDVGPTAGSSTLHVRVAAISYARGDGGRVDAAGVSALLLPAASTSYVYAAQDGSIGLAAGGYPAGTVPLAVVGTDASKVTSISDGRIAYSPLGAGQQVPVRGVVGSGTAGLGDGLLRVDASVGPATITLPAAAAAAGRALTVKKIDLSINAVTVAAQATELIDGAATQPIPAQYGVLRVISNGTSWDVI